MSIRSPLYKVSCITRTPPMITRWINWVAPETHDYRIVMLKIPSVTHIVIAVVLINEFNTTRGEGRPLMIEYVGLSNVSRVVQLHSRVCSLRMIGEVKTMHHTLSTKPIPNEGSKAPFETPKSMNLSRWFITHPYKLTTSYLQNFNITPI